ncbi:MAG: molybdopterin-guanine dinucleotide biosynthesis protein B [Gammaproteobacteria bacterium]|nr:molybdopterin-guanine dinucleotide biosynthesis protein B [Gammaproteobacteria bacterium]
MSENPAVIGFAAYSGTGKTTLLVQLIERFRQLGLRIAVIKHSHHDFVIDQPAKDSYRLHHAGSSQTLLTSRYRSALISEQQPIAEPDLQQSLQQLDLSRVDLVLVEGFRDEPSLARIELHRPALGNDLMYPEQENIIALASDAELVCDIPLLDLNNSEEIVEFILQYFPRLQTKVAKPVAMTDHAS